MKHYKYKLTVHVSETETKETVLDSKTAVCDFLNITPAILENKLNGRLKKNLNYVDIERIFVEIEESKELEEKKNKQKEYNKKFHEKQKAIKEQKHKENLEAQKKLLVEKINISTST